MYGFAPEPSMAAPPPPPDSRPWRRWLLIGVLVVAVVLVTVMALRVTGLLAPGATQASDGAEQASTGSTEASAEAGGDPPESAPASEPAPGSQESPGADSPEDPGGSASSPPGESGEQAPPPSPAEPGNAPVTVVGDCLSYQPEEGGSAAALEAVDCADPVANMLVQAVIPGTEECDPQEYWLMAQARYCLGLNTRVGECVTGFQDDVWPVSLPCEQLPPQAPAYRVMLLTNASSQCPEQTAVSVDYQSRGRTICLALRE